MIITRKEIDELSSDWNTKTGVLKEALEKNTLHTIQISQMDLRYLLWNFCNMREELDAMMECSYGDDL